MAKATPLRAHARPLVAARLRRDGAALGARYLALTALAVVFGLPFVWMVSTSLKLPAQVFAMPPQLVPAPVAWGNYASALTTFPFLRYLWNTIVVVAGVLAGTLLTSSLCAYGFARVRWPGRDAWFFVLLSTLMLPGTVTLIPTFLVFRALHWVNTFLPLIVPSFFGGGAFNIFLLRQYMLTLPAELDDAARIDGCSELGIYWRVVLPLTGPALAAVATFSFVYAWNEFLTPLIYLNDASKYTLAIGLSIFQGQHGADWSLLMAAAVVMTAPTVALFFAAQRYFIQGIALTGMKG